MLASNYSAPSSAAGGRRPQTPPIPSPPTRTAPGQPCPARRLRLRPPLPPTSPATRAHTPEVSNAITNAQRSLQPKRHPYPTQAAPTAAEDTARATTTAATSRTRKRIAPQTTGRDPDAKQFHPRRPPRRDAELAQSLLPTDPNAPRVSRAQGSTSVSHSIIGKPWKRRRIRVRAPARMRMERRMPRVWFVGAPSPCCRARGGR